MRKKNTLWPQNSLATHAVCAFMTPQKCFWIDLNKQNFGTSLYYSSQAVEEYLEHVYSNNNLQYPGKPEDIKMLNPQASHCCLSIWA